MELFAADGHDAGGCERVTGKSGMRPAAEASLPLFDATNGMEPDDARCVGACSDVLRDEHEVVD